MSSLRKITAKWLFFALLLAPTTGVGAGLYGFDQANPWTLSEKKLKFDYLPDTIRNYRADMRDNLLMLVDYAHRQKPNFQVLSHEGQALLYKSPWEFALEGYNRARVKKVNAHDPTFLARNNSDNQEPEKGTQAYRWLHSVNAVVLNNLYCGDGREEDITINHNLGVISIEQCSDEAALDRAVMHSLLDQKIVYAFTDRGAAFQNTSNQPLINDSARNIEKVADAKNITFLLDDKHYTSQQEIVAALENSNFDIAVINPLFHNRIPFSVADIRRMQFKKNGGRRLLIAAFNVSEAAPTDYFWQKRWHKGNPLWLVRESFVTPNALITRYWSEEWRQILSRHFKDILTSDYDGVFFTGIENHHYFEHQTPLE